MSQRVHLGHLVRRRVLARATEEFVFALAPGDELRFRAGQFISVQVGTDGDNNPILRSYSIASPPWRRGELALVLRIVEGGVGSRFFDGLRPGDPLRFTGPMGFFVNELHHPGDVVYVATGTGIAPLLPMAEEALERPSAPPAPPEDGRIFIEWGLRDEGDLFWQDELQRLAHKSDRVRTRIYLSRPAAGWTGLRGRVTGPVLDAVPGLREPIFYLCGNGQMIEELKAALVSRGVNRKRQIRTEAFFD